MVTEIVPNGPAFVYLRGFDGVGKKVTESVVSGDGGPNLNSCSSRETTECTITSKPISLVRCLREIPERIARNDTRTEYKKKGWRVARLTNFRDKNAEVPFTVYSPNECRRVLCDWSRGTSLPLTSMGQFAIHRRIGPAVDSDSKVD